MIGRGATRALFYCLNANVRKSLRFNELRARAPPAVVTA